MMLGGRLRHERAYALAQASLVWNLKDVDVTSWIEHGQMQPEPVALDPEQELAVAEYIKRIQAAGRFVMPE